MTAPAKTHLSPGQVLQFSFDANDGALRVSPVIGTTVPGSLAPPQFDEIALTYITSGNGTGSIGTVVYKLASAVVATLTLIYDSSNRLIDVQKS